MVFNQVTGADGPPVIIDCGSGYTKMGVAGGSAPSHVIPSVLCGGVDEEISFSVQTFHSRRPAIGNQAIQDSVIGGGLRRLIVDGRVSNWSDLETFFHSCYSTYLKVDPSDRPCILTEPPLNPARNREKLAEVMFETFDVPSLYIGVQAVLALYTYWDGKTGMTGTVVDAGDGVTHVIPVMDGYVSGNCVREINVGGKDVTRVIEEALVKRGASHSVALNRLSMHIKEKLAYVQIGEPGNDVYRTIQWTDPATGQNADLNVGHERYLGPEVFFKTLPVQLAESIQSAPIDCRRALMSNIVLSGGSTLFPNFANRLQTEVSKFLKGNVFVAEDLEKQRFAVWHGASILSQTNGFQNVLFTKKQYEEIGPKGARDSAITRCLGL